MFSHIDEFETFFSLESLDQAIKGDVKVKKTEDFYVNLTKKNKEKKSKTSSFSNYNNSPNVICAIQNYAKFMNFIIYIRRPCIPNIFMYIESETSLVFVISSNNSYPIVMVKFPIIQPYIYAKANEMCFDFPLKTISQFIDRLDKTSFQYEMVLKYDDNKMVLEYKSNNTHKIQTTENLTTVNKSVMLNEIFFGKIQNNDLFESDIGLSIDYEDEINSMPVYIIGESRVGINMNKQLSESMIQKLIVTETDVSVYQKVNLNQSTQKLIDRNSKTSYVYWDDTFEPKELNIVKFNSIFKSYDKLINNNDYVYFLICGWREYLQTKTYLFLKVITNVNITNDNIGTFGDLFVGADKLIEFYLCHTQ